MVGKALWQTLTIIIAYKRARAFGVGGREQKILWQSEHWCLPHVRTKTAIELAGTYRDAKVRSDWMVSGFSREIIRGERLDNLAKLKAQNRNKSC